ncbi:MAG TPA: ABC-2 family transporter protein [Methylomirabilota bacterium]|nr:ABC-2 family transporter protein [Methylomirabilota bacterium]
MEIFFKKTKHYTKVYKMLLRLNFARLLAYRADLVNSTIAHTIWASFTIVQMLLLTSKTSHIFGWSRNELLILAGMYNIIYSFFYMFFSRGFNQFSTTINFGRLDGILTKPIDSQFLMTCLNITYTHLIRLIWGVGFLAYVLFTMRVIVTPLVLLGFIVLVVFSVMIIYSFWMLIMTLTIWFPKLSNLADLLYQINQISKFPQEIYKGASLYLLILLFPLTVVIVTPAKEILQKVLVGDVIGFIACALMLFIVSRRFWRFALRFYTSASG